MKRVSNVNHLICHYTLNKNYCKLFPETIVGNETQNMFKNVTIRRPSATQTIRKVKFSMRFLFFLANIWIVV